MPVTADRHFAGLVQKALQYTSDINEAVEAARVAFEMDLDEGGVHFSDPPQRTPTGNQPAKIAPKEPVKPVVPKRPEGPQPQTPTIKSRNDPPPVRQAPAKPGPQPVNPTVKPITSPPPVRRPAPKVPPSGQAEPVDRPQKAPAPTARRAAPTPRSVTGQQVARLGGGGGKNAVKNIVESGGSLYDAESGEPVGHVVSRPKVPAFAKQPAPPSEPTHIGVSSLAPPPRPVKPAPGKPPKPLSHPVRLRGPSHMGTPDIVFRDNRFYRQIPAATADAPPKLEPVDAPVQPEPVDAPAKPRNVYLRGNTPYDADTGKMIGPEISPKTPKPQPVEPVADTPYVVPAKKPQPATPAKAPAPAPAAPLPPEADVPHVVPNRTPLGPAADKPTIINAPPRPPAPSARRSAKIAQPSIQKPPPKPARTPSRNQPATLGKPVAGQPEPVSVPVKVSPIVAKPAPPVAPAPSAKSPKRKTAISKAIPADTLMRRPDGSAIDPVTQRQVIAPGQPEPVTPKPAPKPVASADQAEPGVDPATGAIVDPALNKRYHDAQRVRLAQEQAARARESQTDPTGLESRRKLGDRVFQWADMMANRGLSLQQILNHSDLGKIVSGYSPDWIRDLRRKIESRYNERQNHLKATGGFSLDAPFGQWITMGAEEGADGEDHGGSPVYVEGGTITKGAPDLKGKTLDGIKKKRFGGPSKPTMIDKVASEYSVDRNELRESAERIQRISNDFIKSRRQLFRDAYELSKRLGYGGLKGLARIAAKGGDADAIRGLDDVAMILASNYPEHFKDAPDNQDRLFEILSEGMPKPMRRSEAISKAASQLRTVENAPFSHDIENRKAQGILNKAVAAANKLTAEARREIKEALDLKDPVTSASRIVSAINKHRLQVAKLLSKTQMAALLEGAREVAKHLPPVPAPGTEIPPPASMSFEEAERMIEEMRAMPFWEREEALYNLPADQQAFVRRYITSGDEKPPERPPFEIDRPQGDDPGKTIFPVIDRAVRDLASRNVVTKHTYDRLDAASREKAFAVSGIDAKETLEKVRDAIAKNVMDGPDFRSFRSDVMKELDDESMISDSHLELVFRNNIQSAFSDGQMGVLSHPFVRSGFPYAAYHAIHDDRVRCNHLALESHGINGTNIYRIDDPVFRTFRPPWDWSDRCSWTPLTVQQAAAQSCPEAVKWLESGTEPSPPAFVAHPPFDPPPGFRRKLESLPAAVRLSLQPVSVFAGAAS